MSRQNLLFEVFCLNILVSKRTRYLSLGRRYLRVINLLVETRGTLEMFQMVKAMRTHILAIISGRPLLNSVHPAVGIKKSGFPKLIGFLQTLDLNDMWDLRVLTTLLKLTKALPGHGKPKFESIITPSKGVISPDFSRDFLQLVDDQKLDIPDTSWMAPHLANSSGPNGPSLDQSMHDIKLLPEWQIEDLTIIGGERFRTYLSSCQELVASLPESQTQTKSKGSLLRKQAQVLDPEGKVRIVAMFDYWSQTVLRPIHLAFLQVQKGFRTDCTFNQTGRLHSITPRPRYYSYDLKAATDRFPIGVQVLLLERLFGKSWSEAWRRIMVKLPFHFKGETYHYMAGQPMGGYSSWPIFALCHHLIVLISARRAGLQLPYWNYQLLGDDIVIGDEHVASNYVSIMTELGVDISKDKSLVSKTTFEFAKRLVHNGVEVSPAPFTSLMMIGKDLSALVSFIREIKVRWNLSTATRTTLRSFLSVFQEKRDLHLATLRTYEGQILPAPTDTDEERNLKAWECYKVLLYRYLGCNASLEQIWLALNQFIPMSRIAVIQNTIVKKVKEYNRCSVNYAEKFNKLQTIGNAGQPNLPAQSVMIIPTQRAGLDQARNLQEEMKQQEEAINQGYEERYFHMTPVVGFNPTAVTTDSWHRRTSSVGSPIIKSVKSIVREYQRKRFEELTSPLD